MITNLFIHNYKSLRNVRLEDLPSFCVLVGANASGKSNFADAMDFLSLVVRGGLGHAVRTKGGYENICYRHKRRSKAGLEFEFRVNVPHPLMRRRRRRRTPTYQYHYQFGFRATTEAIAADYKVTNETLEMFREGTERPAFTLQREADGNVKVDMSKDFEKDFEVGPGRYLGEYISRMTTPDDELVLHRALDLFPFYPLRQEVGSCRVYQISPHMARQTGIPERSPELGRQGDNLPAAVEYLRRNESAAFQELLAHLKHTVPAMEKLETEYVETKQLGLFFSERGFGRRWFSQDVSDGTLQTLCLFLPLLDPRLSIVVIEEPENSIHPWILRHFIETCQNASSQKQIFVTTHSPVALSQVDLGSLFIVSRDEDGQTTIDQSAAAYPEARQVVAEHLLGLGEYWDSGAIGGVPESNPED